MTTPDPYTPGTPDQSSGPRPSGGVEPGRPDQRYGDQQQAQQHPGQQDPGHQHPGQQYAGQQYAPQGQGYPPAGYAPGYGQQPENPGRTLGIVGLVLGFLGPLSVVGLVLSIVGLVKSRRVGQPNGVAVAGIVVSGLVLLGTIVLGIVFGLAIGHVIGVCGDLGPGEHVVDGITYTCG